MNMKCIGCPCICSDINYNPAPGQCEERRATTKPRTLGVVEAQAFKIFRDEFYRAISKYPKFNSAHEGFAVLKEEVDELWDEVKKRESNRDYKAMLLEASQVSAMGMRFMIDVILTRGEDKS